MTDLDVLRRVARLVGGKVHSRRKQRLNHKDAWAVVVRDSKAVELMIALYPLMGERRQQQIQEAVWSYDPSRMRKPAQHGTHAMYKRGCRCLDCKEGHRDTMRAWRAD